jgi:hypothetical protein
MAKGAGAEVRALARMRRLRNALKHGRYTAEAVAKRRELSALLRSMKILAKEVAK